MRKVFTRILLCITGFWAATRLLLDYWGYMQAIREAFENRGPIVTALGPILSSQLLPIVLFLFGALLWLYLEGGHDWIRNRFHKGEEIAAAVESPDLVGRIEAVTIGIATGRVSGIANRRPWRIGRRHD